MKANDFIAHGIYTVSNCGGYLVEIHKSGDSARLKENFGSENPEVTDWYEIEYISDPENEDSDMIAVIDPEGYNIRLDSVMRINN